MRVLVLQLPEPDNRYYSSHQQIHNCQLYAKNFLLRDVPFRLIISGTGPVYHSRRQLDSSRLRVERLVEQHDTGERSAVRCKTPGDGTLWRHFDVVEEEIGQLEAVGRVNANHLHLVGV